MGDIGFDFISTEIGSTEFTRTSCSETLRQLNFAVSFMNAKFGPAELPVKIHISKGQYCNLEYGGRVDFNHLPAYAYTNVTLMPHTVQIPSLLNASSHGVYATDSFEPMYNFIAYHLENGTHRIIWYPETAYWVNYDIDIPLFLPLYILTRLRDASNLEMLEYQTGHPLAGQMIFESGWEWGYWLQNAVVARMAFVHVGGREEVDAIKSLMRPFLDIFDDDDAVRVDMESVLLDLIWIQERYILSSESSIIGFLVGKDTWSDITQIISSKLATSPISPINLRVSKLKTFIDQIMTTFHLRPVFPKPNMRLLERLNSFSKELDRVLLKLTGLEYRFDRRDVNDTKQSIYFEVRDSVEMLLYRAKFVYILHRSVLFDNPVKNQLMGDAENILHKAFRVVKLRSTQYRFPETRIAAWNEENPTCYNFMYLWAVKTLYYWKRDLEIAKSPAFSFRCISPCFMNVIDPFDTVLGRGGIMKLKSWAERIMSRFSDCLYAPRSEPYSINNPSSTSAVRKPFHNFFEN